MIKKYVNYHEYLKLLIISLYIYSRMGEFVAMVTLAIRTIGGLGLFILGMTMMSTGLKMSAGKRIKKILSARFWVSVFYNQR